MADNTRLKDLSSKMETVLAILGGKKEKDKLKDERLSLIEQSISSLVKGIETLQQQALMTTRSSHAPMETEHVSSKNKVSNIAPLRSIKMDFPRFDGSQALQWIYQAEQFFDYYEVSDFYRLKIASINFDRPVVS